MITLGYHYHTLITITSVSKVFMIKIILNFAGTFMDSDNERSPTRGEIEKD